MIIIRIRIPRYALEMSSHLDAYMRRSGDFFFSFPSGDDGITVDVEQRTESV